MSSTSAPARFEGFFFDYLLLPRDHAQSAQKSEGCTSSTGLSAFLLPINGYFFLLWDMGAKGLGRAIQKFLGIEFLDKFWENVRNSSSFKGISLPAGVSPYHSISDGRETPKRLTLEMAPGFPWNGNPLKSRIINEKGGATQLYFLGKTLSSRAVMPSKSLLR